MSASSSSFSLACIFFDFFTVDCSEISGDIVAWDGRSEDVRLDPDSSGTGVDLFGCKGVEKSIALDGMDNSDALSVAEDLDDWE